MTDDSIRLDKWLWAARFFKTRALAQEMVQGGKVRYNNQRAKPSKSVEVGAYLQISQGFTEKTVEVLALSAKRGNATAAQTLYAETQASVEKREKLQQQRDLAGLSVLAPAQKPDKKQRRTIIQFKAKQG